MRQNGRRQFLIASGALLAAPRTGRAQQPGRTYRLVALFGGYSDGIQLYRSALGERLSTHGFVEGGNLQIEHRAGSFTYAGGGEPRSELLTAKPDAIFTLMENATQAAQTVTHTVPIVFAWVTDPVALGIVQSYAHPGGNITGVTNRFGDLLVKRLELAHDLLPAVKRVAVIGYKGRRYTMFSPPLRRAAAQLGIDLIEVEISGRGWDYGVERAALSGAEVIVPFFRFTEAGRRGDGKLVVKAAVKYGVRVIFAGAEMVEAGGLMSYGTNLVDDVRRGADLLARVLKGEKPAEIPVDRAAHFELAVNLKTAKAMGITIPPSIMLRADRVIE